MNQEEKPKYNGPVFFVQDIEKSKRFYTDILGQKIEMDFGRCVGFIGGFAIWDSNYALNMLGLDESNKNPLGKKNVEIYFEIEDIDKLYNRIKKKGIEFLHEIKEQPWGQKCFRIYDPDKHIIEFGEPMTIVIKRFYQRGLSIENIVKKTLMPLEIVNNVIAMNKNLNSQIFSDELIAPCGMNCRICIGFFGYTMSGKKRKMICSGCKQSEKSCAFIKKFCKNLSNKKIDYCYECKDFPCKKLKKLDKGYREKYDMSMITNLEYIKEKGMKKFLKNQEEKYECPKCGGVICVHNNKCYSCEA